MAMSQALSEEEFHRMQVRKWTKGNTAATEVRLCGVRAPPPGDCQAAPLATHLHRGWRGTGAAKTDRDVRVPMLNR